MTATESSFLATVITASYFISCHDDQALPFPTIATATAISTATKLPPSSPATASFHLHVITQIRRASTSQALNPPPDVSPISG
ncbi:hypothetical protein TIFTF001_001117 [Ficus carica]|uniref:Uncharacterized protein n=1 Tax=Ficus carica TaxID=3494 RepID=A0AA87ZKJ7_FICCA|nr:hypothetical protein TIFTF001_001117 [Ficus carica]